MSQYRIQPFLLATHLALIVSLSSSVFAQSIDIRENPDDASLEPTPLEELAPNGSAESIPGTEPLYDQGITVTQIEISGNKLVPADTIQKAMLTRPGSLYSKRRLQADLKRIYDLGYFTEHLRVVPVATREGVHLKVEVEENPVVNAFSFDGVNSVKKEELEKFFAEQTGMPQNVNAINQGIQSIEQYYKDKGYVLARVDDIREEPPGTVQLVINEGQLNKIGFSGNSKTKDYVIRRAMAQKENTVYNEKTVSEDMKRIFSTQAFSDVRRVVKASAEKPGEYDLTIEVDEKKTGAISLGGGVDTGTGVFGSVGYSDPNFLGRGQDVSTVFSLGSGVLTSTRDVLRRRVLQSQVSWFNPSLAETSNSLGVSMFARELGSFNVPLAIERRLGSEVTLGHPLEKFLGASVSLGLGFENVFLREGVSQTELNRFGITPAQRTRQLEDGSFVFLAPALAYDSRDNRLSPSRGWFNTVGSRFALGLGNDSYATLTANLRRYLRITDNMTFAINGQGGFNPIGDVPDFNMFRMGGAFTVRGFNEGGIGVGQHFVLGSAELRTRFPFLQKFQKYPLYDMLQAAFFVDAGKLFDESETNDQFRRPGYAISMGAGLRVNIPAVGPLRIDYAIPLTDTNGLARNLNFGVGHKF